MMFEVIDANGMVWEVVDEAEALKRVEPEYQHRIRKGLVTGYTHDSLGYMLSPVEEKCQTCFASYKEKSMWCEKCANKKTGGGDA